MTSGGNNFNYFPENQLTKFNAGTQKFMYFSGRGVRMHPTHLVHVCLRHCSGNNHISINVLVSVTVNVIMLIQMDKPV